MKKNRIKMDFCVSVEDAFRDFILSKRAKGLSKKNYFNLQATLFRNRKTSGNQECY